jgi:hypothetical protein
MGQRPPYPINIQFQLFSHEYNSNVEIIVFATRERNANMALELNIKLRVDFDTANKAIKEPMLIEMVTRAARELLTSAVLMSDSRPPTIAVIGDDLFIGQREIEVNEDEPS